VSIPARPETTGTRSGGISRGAILLLLATLVVPPSEPAAQQRPSFGATVARVRVDVIVTDADGNFVDDLRPDEFTLYEDGAEQQILSTQVVDLGAGTVAEFRGGAGALGGDPAASGFAGRANLETRPVPTATAGDFGAVIYFIDLPGLDRRNKDRFAGEWQRLLNETDLLGIPRAVYMLDQVGRLQELAPLTLSVEKLRDAALAVREAPLVQPGVHARLLRVAADMVADDTVDLLPAQADDLNELRALEAQERARTRATFELLTQFCNALSARRGRTALVWVTSGVQLTASGPGTALAAAYMETNGSGIDSGSVDRSRRTGDTLFAYVSADTNITALQEDLHHAANSANVSIYTVDPMPAGEHRAMPSDVRVGGGQLAELLTSSTVQSSLDALRDALWQAAAETGGRASIGATELGRALQEIDSDTSEFYLLSYAPPAPHGDGEFHSIRVEVLRPGVTVRQRSGYVDLGTEARESRALAAALVLPGAVSGLPVDARTFRGWSAEGEPVVKLVVALEQTVAQQQTIFPEDPFHQIHAVALDTEGRVVDEVHQEMRRSGSPLPTVRSGERPTVYVHEWTLAPGSYDLRVAVRDGVSGEIGATQLDVEVPEPSTDWSASDLMLAVADAAGAAQPLASSSVLPDEALLAYVEVAGGVDPVLSGRLLAADGPQPFLTLPEMPLVEDSAGIHRGALRMRSLPPGDYTLEIRVVDLTAGNERTYRAPLQVLASLWGAQVRR